MKVVFNTRFGPAGRVVGRKVAMGLDHTANSYEFDTFWKFVSSKVGRTSMLQVLGGKASYELHLHPISPTSFAAEARFLQMSRNVALSVR